MDYDATYATVRGALLDGVFGPAKGGVYSPRCLDDAEGMVVVDMRCGWGVAGVLLLLLLL